MGEEETLDTEVTKKYDRRGGDGGEGDSELELLQGMRGTGVHATRTGAGMLAQRLKRLPPMRGTWV